MPHQTAGPGRGNGLVGGGNGDVIRVFGNITHEGSVDFQFLMWGTSIA